MVAAGASSLKANVVWSAARNWVVRLGSAVVFFILARILPPEQIGLFSAALAVIAFVEIVAENGLGDAVIQSSRFTDEIVVAALWCNLVIGSATAVVLYTISPLLEDWLQAPGLAAILSTLILAVLLNSISYVPQAVMRRKFLYKSLAIRATVATGVSGLVGLALAIAGYGIWSMVVQFNLFCALNCLIVWRVSPIRLFVRPDFGHLRQLMQFGFQIFLSRVLYFASTRIIEFVLLYKFGPVTLAYYIMGSRITFIASQLLTAVTVDVALTSFSRSVSDLPRLVGMYLDSLSFSTFVSVPVFVGLAAIAPEFCTVVFGEKGENAVPFMIATSVLQAVLAGQALNGSLLSARGFPGYSACILVLQSVLALAVLLPDWQMTASHYIFVYCGAIASTTIVYFLLLKHVISIRFADFAAVIFPAYAASVLMYACIAGVRYALDRSIGDLGLLVATVLTGIIVYTGFMAALYPAYLRKNVGHIWSRKNLGKGAKA